MPQWFSQHIWRWLLAAVLVSLLGLAIACGDDDDDDDDGGATSAPAQTSAPADTGDGGDGEVDALLAPFFPESGRVVLREAIEQGIIDTFLFTDGTKSQAMFDELGVENFEGMFGTAPGAPNEEFAAAFEAAGGDPGAAYVKEGYDAAYVIALAAAAANSTSGADIAANLRYVSNPPGEEVGFGAEEFARALDLIEAGEDIDFVGASGPVAFDVNGDLASGNIEVWQVVDGEITFQEARVSDLAETLGVEVPAGELQRADAAPTEALKIGSIMSITGDLSDYGPPIQAAIELAISEINEGGGVFGQDVQLATGDDGTLPEQGQTEARRLIDVEGVHAIIGALSSGVTQPIAENVAAPADVVMISPASTAAAITTANDNDLLFRTPIQDVAQAQVLAELAVDQGYDTMCVLYVNTPYGQGLSEGFAADFEELGGTVVNQVSIEQEQTTYVTELQQCVGG
jgi:ABC-type branched-subunit amino acid transport system substrate-binding protein